MDTSAKLVDQSGRAAIREAVLPLLTRELQDWNIDPDAVYLNALDNLESRVVISSESLTDLTVQLILDNEEIDFITDWEGRGLFTRPWSFADEHRVTNAPSVRGAANIIATVMHLYK
ncbi:hypothetical protein ACIPL1_24035 [Pseudomonas sp. NPDC090202]|uniref:hypothetical protein n=1 Tax=unclassified Pseudomonas TaxID=196821 RepID=UPI0037FD7CA7